MAIGNGAGTRAPTAVIHVLISIRHRVSRYGVEVNVP